MADLHHASAVAAPDGSAMFLRPADREREERIAAELRAAWAVELIHMPPLSYLDFLAVRDARPVGWVEVVTRSYTYGQLMDLGGLALKRKTYLTLVAASQVKLSAGWNGARVVWDLADGLYYVHINWATVVSERTLSDPRRAANDCEPVVLFPADAVRPVR
jgi:hypothetical protein